MRRLAGLALTAIATSVLIPATSAAADPAPAPGADPLSGIVTFNYSKGAVQNWTIPAGTTEMTITTSGASGQDGGDGNGDHGGSGGRGSSVTNTVDVSSAHDAPFQPGDALAIYAGGAGGQGQLTGFGGGSGGASGGCGLSCVIGPGGNGGQGGGGSAVADLISQQWISIAGGGGGGGGGDGALIDSNNGGPGGFIAGLGTGCTPPNTVIPSDTAGDQGSAAVSGSSSGGGGGGGGGCPVGSGGTAGSADSPTPGNGGGAGSSYVTPDTVGFVDFGTNFAGGDGQVVINYQYIPPTLTTTPNPTSFQLGSGPAVLKDSATLTGTSAPVGGSITFTLYYNGGSSPVHTETVAVSGDGTYTTAGYALPSSGAITGSYQWDAAYSGDGFNAGASDLNDPAEVVQVTTASPTLTTTPDPTTVQLGTTPPTLNDTATLAGAYNPTGWITFTLLDLRSLGTQVYQEIVPVSGNGNYSTKGYTLPTPTDGLANGLYQWDVSYSGDSLNLAASDNNDPGEQATVQSAQPTMTTQASASDITQGPLTLTDTATLAGGFYPGNAITFGLFYNGTAIYSDVVPVAGNGNYTASYTLPTSGPVTGNYSWEASYDGDGNNNTTPVDVNDPNEQVTVSPAAVSSSTTLGISNPAITYAAEGLESFSGSVSGQPQYGTPQGAVTVFSAGTPLCTAGLASSGPSSATYSCGLTGKQLSAGSYADVYAVYNPATASSSNSNFTYQASQSAPGSLTVNQATPVISWSNPAAIVFGTALGSSQLDATASVPGSMAYTPPAGTLLPPGNGQALTVTFTPADATDYTAATATVHINITSMACVTKATSASLVIGAGQAGCIETGGNENGKVTIEPGGALYMNGGTINGQLTATGATAISLCGVTITGKVDISGSTGPVMFGSASCKNTIGASVSITGNTGGVTYLGNSAAGTLTLTGNSGPFAYAAGDNQTAGKVTVSNNT